MRNNSRIVICLASIFCVVIGTLGTNQDAFSQDPTATSPSGRMPPPRPKQNETAQSNPMLDTSQIATVTHDEIAVIDKDSNILGMVKKGQKLIVTPIDGEPEWLKTPITVQGKIQIGFISPMHVKMPSLTEKLMAQVLILLIHCLVIASIGMMIVFMWKIIMESTDFSERLLRTVSVATGLLAYAGAKAYGISIPDLLASGLDISRPVWTGIWGVAVPAAGGTMVAWFCIYEMKRNKDVGKRVINLLCAFVFTMFADVYLSNAGHISSVDTQYALPNISFIIGIVLYTILRHRTDADAHSAEKQHR